jgi:hypothetical protein
VKHVEVPLSCYCRKVLKREVIVSSLIESGSHLRNEVIGKAPSTLHPTPTPTTNISQGRYYYLIDALTS